MIFIRIVQNQDEGKVLNNDIIQVIKDNEAIDTTNVSFKDKHAT